MYFFYVLTQVAALFSKLQHVRAAEADKCKNEVDKGKSEADKSNSEVDKCNSEVDKGKARISERKEGAKVTK